MTYSEINSEIKRVLLILLSVITAVSSISFAGNPDFDANKNRSEIPVQYKWNLDDIYPDWKAWERDLSVLKEQTAKIRILTATATQSPRHLLILLKKKESLESLGYRLYYYPMIKCHTDMDDVEAEKRFSQIAPLYVRMDSAVDAMTREMLKIPRETMEKWLSTASGLGVYSYFIRNRYRLKKYVLDDEEESLLAHFNLFKQTPQAIYRELFSTDHRFPVFKLTDGSEVTLSPAKLQEILENKSLPAQRKAAYEVFWNSYKAKINLYAAVLNGVCQRDIAFSRARGYKSTLEYYLHEKNVPVAVYENLTKTVRANSGPLRRWAALRAKMFGLETFHSWDTGLLPDLDPTPCRYEKGTAMISAALSPMGPWYGKQVKKIINSRWIDVYPCRGKTALTYNINFHGIHPYILVKYDNRLKSVGILAHELGHAVHSILINQNQPFCYRGPSGLIMETASTLNQHLLTDYLMGTVRNKKQRIAVLWWAIEDSNRFIYYGTMMADFELQVHRAAEQGKPVTAKTLNDMYGKLHEKYYGNTLLPDEYSNLVWAPMSIFYQHPFYTYQYPISFAVSIKLYRDMTTGSKAQRETALKRCFSLLKAGGSNDSTVLLKAAGADITRPETVKTAIDRMDSLITRLENELDSE